MACPQHAVLPRVRREERQAAHLPDHELQELTDKGLVCKRAKGNEYTVSDDRWVLEFYNEHKNDDVPTLVHAVMTNEQMWGQDLTKVPGFEEATVKNLTNIRENGALAAYASCL